MHLRTDLRLAASLDDVFAFFADAENLQALTPPWLHFRILTPRPIGMRRGALIDYGIRLHGIPIRWQSEISAWDPPFRFVDEQRRGPYRRWIHTHAFAGDAHETTVSDHVNFAVPGGRLANWFVARDLRKIFGYRHRSLVQIFGQPALHPPAVTITR